MKEKDSNLGAWLEDHKTPVAIFLFMLVFTFALFTLYSESREKESISQRITMLSDRLDQLESQQKSPAEEVGQSSQEGSSKTPEIDGEQPKIMETQVKGAATVKSPDTVTGKININTASASVLDSLEGIGPTYAARIVEYRQSHGGFKSIEEVTQVKGIGPKTFEKFKNSITIE